MSENSHVHARGVSGDVERDLASEAGTYSICLSQPDDPMTDPIRIFLTVTYYVSERTNELATLPPLRGSIKDPLSFQHARNSALSLAFSCRHSLHVRVHW